MHDISDQLLLIFLSSINSLQHPQLLVTTILPFRLKECFAVAIFHTH